MDLRLAVFDRIAGDDVLRRLLVNYADRLDDPAGAGPASDTCYLTLQWSGDGRVDAPLDAQSLTVRAHMPRSRAEEHGYLDAVLRRLDAALDGSDPDGQVQISQRRSPSEAVGTGADTIFKSRTYDVALLPAGSGLPLPADPGTVRRTPPNGAAPGHR